MTEAEWKAEQDWKARADLKMPQKHATLEEAIAAAREQAHAE
jgi:hypothetical protein